METKTLYMVERENYIGYEPYAYFQTEEEAKECCDRNNELYGQWEEYSYKEVKASV